MNTGTKPLLEIGICRELPHFSFFIGKPDSDFHPKLQPAYDTCAGLNCGYLPYHTTIAKSYPQLVKSIIYSGDDYAAITLRGVVSEKDNTHETSTDLTAVIEYYTPYITNDGNPTTLRVALGNDVSANLILGLATIKAAKLCFDPCDDIVTSSVLENFSPTSMTYMNTIRSKPNNLQNHVEPSSMPDHCKTIVQLANKIEQNKDKIVVRITEPKSDDNKENEPEKIKSTAKTEENAENDDNKNTKQVNFSFIDDKETMVYFG